MQAIIFDVFGTVVDWRSSLIRQFNSLAGIEQGPLSSEALVDEWRVRSRALLDLVRSGKRPWMDLDDIHQESLEQLLNAHAYELEHETVTSIRNFWHRLDPWADVAEGLGLLHRHFVLSAFSNGNLALMVDVARYASLPWDMIFSADLFRHYKPDSQIYQGASTLLKLEPAQIMLCAAHNYDLKKARSLGFKTAFVPRVREFGKTQATDLVADEYWDIVAEDFIDLAGQLRVDG